jgi:hypothetical protein
MRTCPLWFAAVVVGLALPTSMARAAPLAGRFQSPLGVLSVKEAADGTVSGTITDTKNACGFPKGTEILKGVRLDDSCVAGTFKACKVVTGTCAGIIQGDAILLVTKGGALLSGTVHLEAQGCATPLRTDALVLKRVGSPPPPKPPPKQKKEDATTLVTRAQPLIMAGEAEEARKLCQEAVKLDPEYPQGHTCVGVTYYLRERYEEAFEQYTKALEADPSYRDAYYNMASIYAIQGKSEEAIEYLKLSILNGYIDIKTLSTDNDFKNLHGNPAFERLRAGSLD